VFRVLDPGTSYVIHSADALRDEQSSRSARARRSHRTEGVAQTPEPLAGVVLRVGSKTPKVIARPGHALLGLGAPRAFHGHHSERRPGFRAGLCATPTVPSDSAGSGHRGARSRAKGGFSLAGIPGSSDPRGVVSQCVIPARDGLLRGATYADGVLRQTVMTS